MEIILSSFKDTERVLGAMKTIIKEFEFVSVLDLYELLGLLSEAAVADARQGWKSLDGVVTKNRAENVWVLTFPLPEPIS